MNLLFRLKNFSDKKTVEDYFNNQLPKEDDNCFYNGKRLRQIKNDEKVYFSFDGEIVAIGIFTGSIIENEERDSQYKFGHKLTEIRIIDSNIKLDTKIFGTNTTYLDTDKKIEEIARILNR
ncbi:MAG: hypothetical protein DRG78_20520 [Epsilonproteobacteria bacterium]|nr:MAG: hypothetical protein DRG78_20520 [Campylobacterota bacterium]